MIHYQYLNSYCTYNLWFFNFIYAGFGIAFIMNNFRNDKSIPNCNDIFTLICLMMGGNIVPVFTFSQIPELNLLTLLYSLGVGSYAIPNYHDMSIACKQNYSKNFNNLWSFYLIGIILQFFNVLLYVSKFYLIRMSAIIFHNNQNNIDLENRRLINQDSTLLEENYQTTPSQSQNGGTEIENTRPRNQNMYPNLNNIYEND